jgi:hypothetical protein
VNIAGLFYRKVAFTGKCQSRRVARFLVITTTSRKEILFIHVTIIGRATVILEIVVHVENSAIILVKVSI